MAELSLHHHMEISHWIITTQTREVDVGGGGLDTYVVSLPHVLKSVACIVDG